MTALEVYAWHYTDNVSEMLLKGAIMWHEVVFDKMFSLELRTTLAWPNTR